MYSISDDAVSSSDCVASNDWNTVINELELTWKEVVVASCKYHPYICVKVLRKATKILSHISRCACHDLNRTSF
jgi:hypothetical protein